MEKERAKNQRHNQKVYADALKTLTHPAAREPERGDEIATFPVAQALKEYLEANYPKPGPDYERRLSRYGADVSIALVVDRFWHDKLIGDANQDNRVAFYKHRNDEAAAKGKTLVATGRKAELGYVRRALKAFKSAHTLKGAFDLSDDTKTKVYVRTTLMRADLARLLWAARGRRWDREGKCWHPCPSWNRQRPQTIATDPAWVHTLWRKRERRHVARTIMVCAYTTSTAACVTRLRWQPMGETTSYVDLDLKHPKLYRLGPDAMVGKFAGEPVLLNWRICVHLRRWRAMDQRDGFVRVIHQHGKRRQLTYPPTQSFAAIVKDAGLEGQVRIDDLRYSASAHVAEADGVPLRSGALLTGVSTSRFIEVYGHLSEHYQQDIMNAYDRKPGRPLDGAV